MNSQHDTALLFVEALRTFDSQHPQRIRIEGAQRTTLENLSTTAESLRRFNAESDLVYSQCVEPFSQHLQLLARIKQDLTQLESRVTASKERAIRLAEHDGVDLSFLDEPLQ